MLLMEKVKNDHDLIGVKFENNSAPNGALLFGDLLDRCTISPIAEIKGIQEDPLKIVGKHMGLLTYYTLLAFLVMT